MDVDPPLAEGDELEVKLNFENAESVTIKATVAKPGAGMTPGRCTALPTSFATSRCRTSHPCRVWPASLSTDSL